MLESVGVVAHVVVVVVGIGEKVATRGKNVGRTYIRTWQTIFRWLKNFENLFLVVTQCFTNFVAQVGVGVFVADDFYGFVYMNGAVVGRNHHFVALARQFAEQRQRARVLEPRQRERAVGRIGICQFAHHLAVGAGVRKHVHKIQHTHIQRIFAQTLEFCHHFVAKRRLVNLVIRKRNVAAETV